MHDLTGFNGIVAHFDDIRFVYSKAQSGLPLGVWYRWPFFCAPRPESLCAYLRICNRILALSRVAMLIGQMDCE